MKQKKMWRQGDVLLRQIQTFPKGLKEKDKILAHGEVTFHTHRFEDEHTKVLTDGNQQYVVLEQPAELIHEEHESLEIPKGVYEVVIQREYDVVEGARRVMD